MNTHLRVFCIGLMIATFFGCGEQAVTEPVAPHSPQDSDVGDDASLTDIDEEVGIDGDTAETHDSGPESDALPTSDASSPPDSQPQADIVEVDTITDPQGDAGGDSSEALPASYYDGLVIAEIMVDPVGISDANGE